jgi:hypothetical protein
LKSDREIVSTRKPLALANIAVPSVEDESTIRTWSGVTFSRSAALKTDQSFAAFRVGTITPTLAQACRPTVNPEESDDGFFTYAFVTE